VGERSAVAARRDADPLDAVPADERGAGGVTSAGWDAAAFSRPLALRREPDGSSTTGGGSGAGAAADGEAVADPVGAAGEGEAADVDGFAADADAASAGAGATDPGAALASPGVSGGGSSTRSAG